MRKTENMKDYSTLTDNAISFYALRNLEALVQLLNDKMPDDKLSRRELIKVSVSLNNLLKELEK